MLVNFFHSYSKVEKFDFAADNLKGVLSLLKFQKGSEFTDELLQGEYKYIIADSTGELKPLYLIESVVFSNLAPYDTLFIIPKLRGDVSVAVIGGLIGATAITTVSALTALQVAALVLTAVINIAISLAIGFLVSLIAPTPEFDSDPAAAQANLKQSNLFNGAPLIREQGGIVPLIYGNPYAGGVLISSGITTVDIL